MVGRIVKGTCKEIWDNLHALHVHFPENDKVVDSVVQQVWNKWKFPNCDVCIDGKRVYTESPSLVAFTETINSIFPVSYTHLVHHLVTISC